MDSKVRITSMFIFKTIMMIIHTGFALLIAILSKNYYLNNRIHLSNSREKIEMISSVLPSYMETKIIREEVNVLQFKVMDYYWFPAINRTYNIRAAAISTPPEYFDKDYE